TSERTRSSGSAACLSGTGRRAHSTCAAGLGQVFSTIIDQKGDFHVQKIICISVCAFWVSCAVDPGAGAGFPWHPRPRRRTAQSIPCPARDRGSRGFHRNGTTEWRGWQQYQSVDL